MNRTSIRRSEPGRPLADAAPPRARPVARRVFRRPSWLALVLVAGFAGCTGRGGRAPNVSTITFAPLDAGVPTDVLTQADADRIVQAAAESIDSANIAIAVTDRIGNILRVWNRNPGSTASDCDNKIATSLARTTAYLSHSQAPLTSRTGQFISTFHFPARFDPLRFDSAGGTDCAPVRPTEGVANTPQGPLWQIDASNRGAPIESTATNPPTMFDAGKSIPILANPDGSTPSPGLTPLPGGVPLYKRVSTAGGGFSVASRLVGGIGVYVTDAGGLPQPEVAEFAALAGAGATNPTTGTSYGFPLAIPTEGAVFLVGVLLPFVEQTVRPTGIGTGTYSSAQNVTIANQATTGAIDPFGWLISPRDSASGVAFTANEVQTAVEACVQASLETHAAIRLPAVSPCQMIISVTDVDGVILGCFRMEDATLFSLEISIAKARNAVYFSNSASIDLDGPRAGMHPLAGIVPPGTAITARTLGFLTQPFFPPTIDGNPPGPLFELALENRKPVRFDQQGFAPPATDDSQSGVIFFPGSAPLYRDGVLIGGIGVSGDGVEQDDFVTAVGIDRAQRSLNFQLEPPRALRCDNFSFRGVTIPYMKFPQNPGG